MPFGQSILLETAFREWIRALLSRDLIVSNASAAEFTNHLVDSTLLIPAGTGAAPELQRWCQRIRACDLDHASGPRADGKSETVQLYNRGYQVEAKTEA